MKPLSGKISRKELLALPCRKWNDIKIYDYLYIISSGRKYGSGYSLMSVIGVSYIDNIPQAEIAAVCDDICWSFPVKHPYDKINKQYHSNMIRTDCLYPSGIIRMWASGEHYFSGKFEVGVNVSSTEIILKIVPRGDGINKINGEQIT